MDADYECVSEIDDDNIQEKYVQEKREMQLVKNKNHISMAITSLSLANYAITRMKNSDQVTRWPPRMLEIISYVNTKYPRKTLFTELTIAMIELCLKLPIQWNFNIDGHLVDLNKEGCIIFEDKSFVNAITIIIDLLDCNFLSYDELRLDRKIIDEIRKRS